MLQGAITGPPLHLDLHIYADDPARRAVFINGDKYREGDQIGNGPLVHEIVPEGAVLPLDVGSAGRVLGGETSTTGWVESVGEREPGVASVSAAVHVDEQLVAAVSVIVFSFAVTYLIATGIQRTIGLRVDEEDELTGLDQTQHAESAYTA